jgi:hypothetical protein
VDKQVATMTPWISSSAFKFILLELIMQGSHEPGIVSTTNPIYSHRSLFSRINRQLRSGLSIERKDWVRTSSQQWAARKTKTQTPRNKPAQLTDHAFSRTNRVLQFLVWNKCKVGAKESSRQWASGKKKKIHLPNGQCQASSTLENGFTVEYFSVCWMRRAEVRS